LLSRSPQRLAAVASFRKESDMFATRWTRQPSWNPWLEMERLNAEMNRLFQTSRPTSVEYPPIDVWTSEQGARVTALLPGYQRDDVDVSVVGNTLTLKGGMEIEPDADASGQGERNGRTYHRRERESHKFARTVELPFEVEVEKVTARLENGLLEVLLPRSLSQLPRKITVTS
jgi:HSP20 family protein